METTDSNSICTTSKIIVFIFLPQNVSIVDYERMVGTQGQRVAAFGKFAGVAGVVLLLLLIIY